MLYPSFGEKPKQTQPNALQFSQKTRKDGQCYVNKTEPGSNSQAEDFYNTQNGDLRNNLCKKAIPVKKRAEINSIVTHPASFELTLDNPQRGLGRLKQTMRSAAPLMHGTKLGRLKQTMRSAAPLMHGTKPKRSGSLDNRSKAKVAWGVLALVGAAILPLILAISVVIMTAGIQGGINDLGKLLPFVLLILNVVVRPLRSVMSDYVFPVRLRPLRANR